MQFDYRDMEVNVSSYKRKLMDVPNIIVGIWICGMFTIFPLIYNNRYYDILQAKYGTVLVLTIIMISAMIMIYGFSSGFTNFLNKLEKKGFKDWFREEISFTDRCMMIYIIITVISTSLAYPYVKEAVLGNEGRYSGLILISLYVSIYFIVSRFFAFSKVYFTIFLSIAIPVCIFGYTDYFKMDILKFKRGLSLEQQPVFTSTIGNINTYTAVIAFYIAVAGTLFITTPLKDEKMGKGESIAKIIFYYIIMFMSFIAIAMGNSDNGYLSLGIFFALMPFVAFQTMEGVRRYVLTVFSYLVSIKIIALINAAYGDGVLGISGLYEFISNFKYLNLLIILFGAVAAALYIFAYTKRNEAYDNEGLLKALKFGWIGILVLGFLATVYLAISVNGDLDAGRERYGSLANYFIFNDDWGTYRGYIWRAAIEEYMKKPVLHRIFGTGPDTFGIYISKARYSEMTHITGQFFDAAHNEYIQFLFTLGPIATIAYILALIVPSVKALKTKISDLANENVAPFLYACAFAVICYGTQAIVNLNLPVVTPFLWIFLSIMVSILRNKGEA